MIKQLNINKVRGIGIRNLYTYRKKKGNTYNKILFHFVMEDRQTHIFSKYLRVLTLELDIIS